MKTVFYWTLFLGICALCITAPQDEDLLHPKESFSGLLDTYSELKPRGLSTPRRACSSDERCTKTCKARQHDYGQCVNRICNCDDYPASIKRMMKRSGSSSPRSGNRSPSRTASTRSRRSQKASASKTPRRSTTPKKRTKSRKGGYSTTPKKGSRSSRTPSRRRYDLHRKPVKRPSRGKKKTGKGGTPARRKKSNGNNRAGRGGRGTPSKAQRPSKPVKTPAWMQGNVPFIPPDNQYPSYNTASKGPPARPSLPSPQIPPSATQRLPGASLMGNLEGNDGEDEDMDGSGAGINFSKPQAANSGKGSRGDQIVQTPFKQPQTEKYEDFANEYAQSKIPDAGKAKGSEPPSQFGNSMQFGMPAGGDKSGTPGAAKDSKPPSEFEDSMQFGMPAGEDKSGTPGTAKGSKPPSEFEDSMQFDMSGGGDKSGAPGTAKGSKPPSEFEDSMQFDMPGGGDKSGTPGTAKDSKPPSEFEDSMQFDMANGDEAENAGDGKKKDSKEQQLGQKPGSQFQTEEKDGFANDFAQSKPAAPGVGKGPEGEQLAQKPTSQSQTEEEGDFGNEFAQDGLANTGKASGTKQPSEFGDSMQFGDAADRGDEAGTNKATGKPNPASPKQETDFESFNSPNGEYEANDMFGMSDGMPGAGLGGQNKNAPNGGQSPQQFDFNGDSAPFGNGQNKMPTAGNGMNDFDMDGFGLEGMQKPPPSQNSGSSKDNEQAMMNSQGGFGGETPPFGPFNGKAGETISPNLNGGMANGAMTNSGLRDDDDMMSNMDYSSMMKPMGGNPAPMTNNFGPTDDDGMGGMNYPGMGTMPPGNTPFPMKGADPMSGNNFPGF